MATFEKAILAILWVSVVALVGAIAVGVWFDVAVWPSYREKNHCKETGETRAETGFTTVVVWKTIMLTPNTRIKREWSCDNGAIWR